jgi:hypothetical protein
MPDDDLRVNPIALGVAVGAAGGQGQVQLTVTWRAYFSRTHMRSAALQARRAIALDQNASPLTSDEGIEHVACAISAMLTSVAAIEAAISEVYVAAVEQKERGGASDVQRALAGEWEGVKGKPTHEGAKIALDTVGQNSNAVARWDDIADLLKLRNILTHYTAGPLVDESSVPGVFVHQGDKHLTDDLLRRLDTKQGRRRSTVTDAPYFPLPYLNGSYATWAVEASREFVDSFCRLMNHPSPFTDIEQQALSKGRPSPFAVVPLRDAP